MRQGGDPRLPLELALVKVTRPGVRPLARVARLPARAAGAARDAAPASRGPPLTEARGRARRRTAGSGADGRCRRPSLGARRSTSSSCRRRGRARSCRRSRSARSRPRRCSREAHPAALEGDTLTLEFPPSAAFHLRRSPRTRRTRPLLARRALRGDRPPARARVRARRGAERARRRRARRGAGRRGRRSSSC